MKRKNRKTILMSILYEVFLEFFTFFVFFSIFFLQHCSVQLIFFMKKLAGQKVHGKKQKNKDILYFISFNSNFKFFYLRKKNKIYMQYHRFQYYAQCMGCPINCNEFSQINIFFLNLLSIYAHIYVLTYVRDFLSLFVPNLPITLIRQHIFETHFF